MNTIEMETYFNSVSRHYAPLIVVPYGGGFLVGGARGSDTRPGRRHARPFLRFVSSAELAGFFQQHAEDCEADAEAVQERFRRSFDKWTHQHSPALDGLSLEDFDL